MCQFIIYSCIDSDINSKYSESFLLNLAGALLSGQGEDAQWLHVFSVRVVGGAWRGYVWHCRAACRDISRSCLRRDKGENSALTRYRKKHSEFEIMLCLTVTFWCATERTSSVFNALKRKFSHTQECFCTVTDTNTRRHQQKSQVSTLKTTDACHFQTFVRYLTLPLSLVKLEWASVKAERFPRDRSAVNICNIMLSWFI